MESYLIISICIFMISSKIYLFFPKFSVICILYYYLLIFFVLKVGIFSPVMYNFVKRNLRNRDKVNALFKILPPFFPLR